ncbi:MAG: hypothetical protein WCE94_02655 [Candidatus Methanoperedens sp.]
MMAIIQLSLENPDIKNKLTDNLSQDLWEKIIILYKEQGSLGVTNFLEKELVTLVNELDNEIRNVKDDIDNYEEIQD